MSQNNTASPLLEEIVTDRAEKIKAAYIASLNDPREYYDLSLDEQFDLWKKFVAEARERLIEEGN